MNILKRIAINVLLIFSGIFTLVLIIVPAFFAILLGLIVAPFIDLLIAKANKGKFQKFVYECA